MADARAEADAAQLAVFLKRTQAGAKTITLSIQRFTAAARAIVQPVAILLALFLIHQLFLWCVCHLDQAPPLFDAVLRHTGSIKAQR